MTLRVSIWDKDWNKPDDFIGEVTIPLEAKKGDVREPMPNDEADTFYSGSAPILKLSYKWRQTFCLKER